MKKLYYNKRLNKIYKKINLYYFIDIKSLFLISIIYNFINVCYEALKYLYDYILIVSKIDIIIVFIATRSYVCLSRATTICLPD